MLPSYLSEEQSIREELFKETSQENQGLSRNMLVVFVLVVVIIGGGLFHFLRGGVRGKVKSLTNAAVLTGPKVKGILVCEGEASAIIGTEVVRVGDYVGDAEVVAIESDKVVFRKGDETWEQEPFSD